MAFLEGHPGSTRQRVLEGLRPGANPEAPEASEVLLHLGNLVANGGAIEFFNGTLALPRGGLRPEAKKPEGSSRDKGTPETAAEEVQDVTLPESEEPQVVPAEIPAAEPEAPPETGSAPESAAGECSAATSSAAGPESAPPAAEAARPE